MSEHPDVEGPRGPDDEGGPPLLIRRIHRMWALASTARIASEGGVAHLSLPRIAVRAGLRLATVELLFLDAEECLLETFDLAASLAAQRVIPWFAGGIGGAERLRVAVGAAMGFCEDEPELARVLCLEHPPLAARRARMTSALGTVLAEEFERETGRLDTDAATTALERALMIVRGRVSDGLGAPFAEVGSEILATLLTPFLGAPEARLQAARPVTPSRVAWEPPTPTGERPRLDVRLSADLIRELARTLESPPPKGRRDT